MAFKETYPSHLDPTPGGVVGAGETYEENATRELEEEMGVIGVSIDKCLDFFYTDNVCSLWGRLFKCTFDGAIVLQESEVESGKWVSYPKLLEYLDTEQVCPDSMHALNCYLGLRGDNN